MAAMPQTLTTKPLDDATAQVVVLAFDLAGQQLANLPTLLQNSLADKTVQSAIQSTLESFMLKRMTSGNATSDFSPKDAQDLLNALTSSTGGKLSDAALQQIKNSPAYKKLEKAFADFQAAAKACPMGVWVDNNKAIVYVTGIALAIGGVAVLYATKTGGTVVNFATSQITNKPLQIFKVGNFTLQGQVLAFQPDKQTLGLGAIATQNWQQVSVSVSIGLIAAGTQAQQVKGQVVFKTKDVNVSVTANDTLANKKVDLGLSLGVTSGPLTGFKLGVGAVITDGKVTGGTATGSYKTPYGDFGLQGQAGNNQYQGLATWSYSF